MILINTDWNSRKNRSDHTDQTRLREVSNDDVGLDASQLPPEFEDGDQVPLGSNRARDIEFVTNSAALRTEIRKIRSR